MKKIKSLEYNTMIWFIIRAGFTEITLTAIIHSIGQDSWISLIIGAIIGLIPFTIYEYLKNKYPEDNYVSLNKKLFKKTGNILNMIVFIGCLIANICTFWVLVHFANSLFLYRTSSWIISLILIFPILYAATKGIHIISKVSLILFYISILFCITIMIGLTNEIDINNVKPILENNPNKIFYSSLIFSAFNIVKVFFLNIIPKDKITNHSSKINYLTYAITCLNIINITIMAICIFGIDLAKLYEYPAFQILKRVNILGVIDRVESILSVEGMFSIFIEMSIITYYGKETITQTFKLKEKTNKYIIIPICLITVITSNLIFKNHELGEQIFTHYLVYIIYFIFVFLPIITLLKSLYNAKMIKRKNNTRTDY